MHMGKVLSEGTPAQVLDDPAVGAAYLGTDQTALSRSGPSGALLTVAEYADRYSVSTSTVRRRVDRGELEAVREGRRLLVRG